MRTWRLMKIVLQCQNQDDLRSASWAPATSQNNAGFNPANYLTACSANYSHKTRGIKQIIMSHEGIILEFLDRRSLSDNNALDRVDLDWLYDRINLVSMIQIKYVNATQQLADIFTKGSFTRDGWTQLTSLVNIMTHTTFAQSNLSVSSAFVNPPFSSVSKRAGESFAASASAKQKLVHCTAMIARKLNHENADMDYQAVPPPSYKPGGDSKREELVSARP